MADESTERILILLQARDRDLQRAIDRNSKEVRRFAQHASKDTKRMATEIDSHMSQVSKTVMGVGKSFAVGLGAGVIGAAFAGVTTNLAGLVRGIAEVGDMAKRSGLSAQAFQEWQFVAEQNRIPVDSLVDSFKELSLRADEFIQTGAGPAKESLQRLGISASELKTKLQDPSALMLEIVGRMQDMDTAAQIRIADELFGGTGGERFVELLSQGEAGLRSTIDRAHEVGAVLDEEMIAKAAEIDRRFQEIGVQIANAFKVGVVGVADFFTSATTAADILIAKFGTLEEAKERLGSAGVDEFIAGSASDAADMIYDYEDATRAADAAAASLAEQARETVLALLEAAATLDLLEQTDAAEEMRIIAAEMGAVVTAFSDGESTAEEFANSLDTVRGNAESVITPLKHIDGASFGGVIANLGGLGRALVSVRDMAIAAMGAVTALAPINVSASGDDERGGNTGNFRNAFTGTRQAPTSSPRPMQPSVNSYGDWLGAGSSGSGAGTGGGGGGRGDKDSFAASVEQIQQRTAALEAEAAAFLEVAGANREYGDAAEFARQKAKLLADAQKEGKEITPELVAEIDRLSAAYVDASEAAQDAAERLDDLKDRSERGADAITDVFMALGQGSDSVKKAIASLLIEMAKVQAQKAFMNLAGTGGGGIFGLIGGLLGGKRALGGPVQAGVPYLVNENTANSEVFVPSSSGAILNVPQAQAALRGSMGGSGAVQGGGGTSRLVVTLGDGLVAQILDSARDQAVQIVEAGLSNYDRVLPQRVAQVSSDRRRRD